MIRKASKKDIPDIVKIYEKVISSKDNLTGCSVLRFNANINNTPARKLYEKHGCLKAGMIRRALNGLPEAVYVLYEKKLK